MIYRFGVLRNYDLFLAVVTIVVLLSVDFPQIFEFWQLSFLFGLISFQSNPQILPFEESVSTSYGLIKIPVRSFPGVNMIETTDTLRLLNCV
jgi:hypothetical protein